MKFKQKIIFFVFVCFNIFIFQPLINNLYCETKTTEYIINSGDTLGIKISPAEELSKDVIVGDDGTIEFPLIGTVSVKGITKNKLENILQKKLSKYITNPKVEIIIRYYSKKQITLLGEVIKPGIYQYKDGLHLFELITQIGGFTPNAGIKNIKVYRGQQENKKIIVVNLEDIIKNGDFSKDFLLNPGDVVEVPKLPKKISIIGAINSPGNYDYTSNMHVLDAISIAGGPKFDSNLKSVKIFREYIDKRKVIQINLAKIIDGKTEIDITIEPGDIIVVPYKKIVSGTWFVNNILPWLSLITMLILIKGYTGI